MSGLLFRMNSLVLGAGLTAAGTAKIMKIEPEVKSIQALQLPDWSIRNIGAWQMCTGSMLLIGGVYPGLTLFRTLGVYGSYASVGGQFGGLISRSSDKGQQYADWQIADNKVIDKSTWSKLRKLPVIYAINATHLFLTYSLSRFGCGRFTPISHDFLLNLFVLSAGYYGISVAVDELEECPDISTFLVMKQKQFELARC